jgi:hypothetical protein
MKRFAKCMALAVSFVSAASCAVEPDDGSAADVSEIDGTQTSDVTSQIQARESENSPSDTGVVSVDDTDISIDAASDCPAGFFCLWQDANFVGRRVQFQDSGCQNLTTFGFSDRMSSWFNRNGGAFRVYMLAVESCCFRLPLIRARLKPDLTTKHRQSAAAPALERTRWPADPRSPRHHRRETACAWCRNRRNRAVSY